MTTVEVRRHQSSNDDHDIVDIYDYVVEVDTDVTAAPDYADESAAAAADDDDDDDDDADGSVGTDLGSAT